jgi:hypothetical protein
MLNRFNSNARKLNRVMQQINLNNLSGSGYLDNLVDDYIDYLLKSENFEFKLDKEAIEMFNKKYKQFRGE